jgi:hypothetical protein
MGYRKISTDTIYWYIFRHEALRGGGRDKEKCP